MSQVRHHQQQQQQQQADGRKKVGSGNLDAYAEIFKFRQAPASTSTDASTTTTTSTSQAVPDSVSSSSVLGRQQVTTGGVGGRFRIMKNNNNNNNSTGVVIRHHHHHHHNGASSSVSGSGSGSASLTDSLSSSAAASPHKKSAELIQPGRGSSSSSSGDSPMFEVISSKKSGEVSRISVSSGEIARASCSSSGEMDDYLHYTNGTVLNDTHVQDDFPRYSFDASANNRKGEVGGGNNNNNNNAATGGGGGGSSGGSSSGGSPTPEIFNRGRKNLDTSLVPHATTGSNHSSAGSSDGGSPTTADSLWGGKLSGGMVTGGSFSSFSTVTNGGAATGNTDFFPNNHHHHNNNNNYNSPVGNKKRPTNKEEAISSSSSRVLLHNGGSYETGRLNGATTAASSRFVVGTTAAPRSSNSARNAGPPRDYQQRNNMSPEDVKTAGNVQYKKGNFSEALLLYDRAISLCPDQAAYRCNRAAALAGLGRLAEALKESEMAIKLDPEYNRAHQRLASLHIRLGQIDEARKYMRLAGLQNVVTEAQCASAIEKKLANCVEAKRTKDWNNVVKECDGAIVAGADSSVEIYAMKAEALFKLHRLDEADAVLVAARRLEDVSPRSTKNTLLVLRAQIDMAQGRFEEAVAVAERAARLEPRNTEICSLLRKSRTVAKSRTAGNDFFKAAKYFEACAAYTEGLELDPANSVLLCNRAASRSKLGQWEKSLEDCNAALRLQPKYMKALLRRAQSYAKLERWEGALRDYEALRRELPGDVEVAQAHFEVQLMLKQARGEEISKTRFGGVEVVSRNDRFTEAISRPGLSVVEFTTQWDERCREFSTMVDELSTQYLSVNFSRVDVDESPYLAQIENIGSVPTFKIYRNGVKVRELLGPTLLGLEEAVKQCGL